MQKLLTPRCCPVHGCERVIYEFDKHGRPAGLNNDGMLFWVKFCDESKAQFSICKDCFNTLDDKKIKELNDDQRYTWGMEIIQGPLGILALAAQLKWYVEKAVFLEIISWAREEYGL